LRIGITSFAQARTCLGAGSHDGVGEPERKHTLRCWQLAEQRYVAVNGFAIFPGHSPVPGKILPSVGSSHVSCTRPGKAAVAQQAQCGEHNQRAPEAIYIRLRIWGSGVRISSGAPLVSMVCAVAFCGPFCKICFQDVLELSDSALGKLASSRQVLVENFLSTAQCVPRDCDDLTDATTSAE